MLAAFPAWATTQCPPGTGEHPLWFWILGWSVFGLFVLAGLAVPVLALRLTRGRHALWRALATLVALAAMLGLWLLGLALFVGVFVMEC